MKIKWTKHCFFYVDDNDDTNAKPDNTIFTIKDAKLYISVATLSAKDNQKLQNFLAKDLKDQFLAMNIK